MIVDSYKNNNKQWEPCRPCKDKEWDHKEVWEWEVEWEVASQEVVWEVASQEVAVACSDLCK
jgi:hypothetical protein